MAKVISLNRFRKDKDRRADRAEADANAAKFGRTKAEKALDQARAAKSASAQIRSLSLLPSDQPVDSMTRPL